MTVQDWFFGILILFGSLLLFWGWAFYAEYKMLRKIGQKVEQEKKQRKDRLREAEDRLEQMLREREQEKTPQDLLREKEDALTKN